MYDKVHWRARTVLLAARYQLPERRATYVGFDARCWNCHQPVPVFLWPGIRHRVPPPVPAPQTVKRRQSATLGDSYPSNGCIHCDSLFGEFYLLDLVLNYVEYDEGAELVDRFLNDGRADRA